MEAYFGAQVCFSPPQSWTNHTGLGVRVSGFGGLGLRIVPCELKGFWMKPSTAGLSMESSVRTESLRAWVYVGISENRGTLFGDPLKEILNATDPDIHRPRLKTLFFLHCSPGPYTKTLLCRRSPYHCLPRLVTLNTKPLRGPA